MSMSQDIKKHFAFLQRLFYFYFRRWTTYQLLDLYNTVWCFLLLSSQKLQVWSKRKTSQKIVLVWIQQLNLKNINKGKYIQIYFLKFDFSFLFSHKNLCHWCIFFLLASKWKNQIYFSIFILQSVKKWTPFCKNVLNEWKKISEFQTYLKKLVLKPSQRFE